MNAAAPRRGRARSPGAGDRLAGRCGARLV